MLQGSLRLGALRSSALVDASSALHGINTATALNLAAITRARAQQRRSLSGQPDHRAARGQHGRELFLSIRALPSCPLGQSLHPGHSTRAYASSISASSAGNSAGEAPHLELHSQEREYRAYKKQRRRYRTLYLLAALGLGGVVAYHFVPPFRQLVIAVERSGAVAVAVAGCIYDYKVLFRTEWDDPRVRHLDYKACHKRCAERILAVLQRNGGIYIKLGQHLSSVQLVPEEWSSTMRPLQDQCHPTPLADVQGLFLRDVGEPIENLFSDFDPEPIGVASLAQVHLATDKISGRKVAVKIMHPDLQEFTLLDMKTTSLMLKVVKAFFPTFEFTWLGEEMEQSLPLEMDFRHEAANAKTCVANFAKLKHTSLVVPDVLWSQERILVMEFIDGGRVDDLEYLSAHNIDRNAVSCEISRIFSQMLFIDGCFHGDPHAGNLLIRPVPLSRRGQTRSKHNFEIVLLDHGLWFDITDSLRVNYARLWLSLIAPKSEKVDAERRKYAELVGNIGPDLFPIFEAAITGRAGLSDEEVDESGGLKGTLDGSLMGLATQTPEEAQRLRNAFMQEGMITSIFELLRRVPRRLLMILKINDLTRSLDKSLNPSHPIWRIWIIVARFCCVAAYTDDMEQLRSPSCGLHGFALFRAKITAWASFQLWYRGLGLVEFAADRYAKWMKVQSWVLGLLKGGWKEARAREAGLVV